MDYHVLEMKLLGGHRVFLRFHDGSSGEIDLSRFLSFTGVFEPLRDPEEFARVKLDEEWHTLVWPNDVDIAPETLHEWVAKTAVGR